MRGVFHHGPHDVADGLTAHYGAWREGLSQSFRALRFYELNGAGVGTVERFAGGVERGDLFQGVGVFGEVEVKTFGTQGAIDEPIEGLGDVPDLLGDCHAGLVRAESGIGFGKDACRAVKEVLTRDQLAREIVGRLRTHGGKYTTGRGAVRWRR